jgi:hypothetical protein
MLVSMGTELNDLTPRTTLKVNLLGQFDLNPEALSGESAFHTQYLIIRHTSQPLETLALTGTVVGGLAENQVGDLYAQFAASGGVDWEAPGALQDMAQLEVRWSSGTVNDRIIAFSPITSIAQGDVFTPKLSGLMAVKG